jgi:SagB-type dehydrogenase family enzyme
MSNQDFDIALTYHEETNHTYDSVYRSHHFLDWDNQPRSYKIYTGLDPLPLPDTLPTTHTPMLHILTQTIGTLASAALPTLAEIAYLLYYAAGVTRRRIYPGHGEVFFRAAACTGALYHIDLYLTVADLPDLAAGVYHFDPIDFALRPLRQGDYRRVLVEASADDQALSEAPLIVIAADTFWRNTWKYRARAYRHSFWDSGTILANLLVAATGLGRPARLITGFVDSAVNTLIDVEPAREAALYLTGIGSGAPAPASAPPVQALQLEVAPLSAQESDYPAVRIMHQASMLDHPREVEAWRQETPPLGLPPATQTVFSLKLEEDAATDGLEAVIRRRGSTRQFAHLDITLSELSNVLIRSTQDIPADFSTPPGLLLNDMYLLVHAVTGLPPGAYVYHPREQTLELLQENDYRYEAAMLALGQELAADASVNVYFLCDLMLVLEYYGNRGYRIAQLEAGLLAGRMYLAAYAQGLGATGLTFFDDDVIETFAPHAAGKSVMFLLALGYSASRH